MKYKDIKNELREGMKVQMSRCAKPIGIYRLAGGAWDFRIDDCFHTLKSTQDAEWEILTEADGVTPYKRLCTDPCDCDGLKSKSKFKVGDRVRIHGRDSISSIRLNGQIATITRVENTYVNVDKEGANTYGIQLCEIEKIEDAPKSKFMAIDYALKESDRSAFTTLYFNEPQAQKSIFMNIVDKIKNFKLSAEDRILRENGLEDDNGKITEEAKIMMHEELRDERWATRRLEIAADLLKIKAEEK